MPSRRRTKVASRAKPLLPKDEDNITMDEDIRKAKLEDYLKDFDIEVEKRVAEMQRLCGTMCSQIQAASNMYLLRLPKDIKKMKQVDYFAQSGIPTCEKVMEQISKTVDDMVTKTLPSINQIASASASASSSSEADEDSSNSTTAEDTDCSESTTGRKTRTARKKTATAKKKETTAKRASSRKRGRPALQETPAHQNNTNNTAFQTPMNPMPMSSMATPFITPKFDPNSKMTPATLRRAKKGELLVSLSGSPVEARNSPKERESVDKIKENMENLFNQDSALNEMDRKNILMLQETLSRMLKDKTKVEPGDA